MERDVGMKLRTLWRNRAVNLGVRAGVLVVIIAWLVTQIDLNAAALRLVALNVNGLLAMIAAALLFAAVGGVKVWTLLRAVAPVSPLRTVSYFFLASSIGSFTPASLGDFSLAAFLKREGVPLNQGAAVVLVDRLVTLSLYVLVFVPLTLAFLAPDARLWWLPALYVVGALLVLGVNANPGARGWLRERIVRRSVPHAEDFMQTVSQLGRAYPLAVAANVLVGLVRAVVGGIVVWFALYAVGTAAPLLPVISATNGLSVVNLLPISFGSLGVYEGGGVLLFQALGLEAAAVFAALFLQRVYVLVSSLIFIGVGMVVWQWRKRAGAQQEARAA